LGIPLSDSTKLDRALATVPAELADGLRESDTIVRSYLAGLGFIVRDTARDERYWDNHLLSYLTQDLIESSVLIISSMLEGVHRAPRRELRFIIETSIKICFVQQKDYQSSIADKLLKFDKELASLRISINRNIELFLLTDELRKAFADETGRLYGMMSDYVHLSPMQIQERIDAVDAGRTAGRETPSEIKALNELLARVLAVSLTLLFHSVPDYVAGDWLVEEDGSSLNWYFSGSRFIADLDAHFDYKHERQHQLAAIQSTRKTAIRF
jgi:hypothetical protein